MTDDVVLNLLAERVAGQLIARDSCLATAESCTGGWIAKCCTDLAGSSQWFERGFVTYSNQAKQEMLAVKPSTLATHGAVSEAVVIEMATGALMHSRADVAVAVSGIAGPGGGTDEKPVGTVWLAWATEQAVISHGMLFTGDRESIRRQTVEKALQGILDTLADS